MALKLHRVLFLLLALVSTAKAYYNPTTGRWLSRDPLADGVTLKEFSKTPHFDENVHPFEQFKNLYGANENNAVSNIDPFGLSIWTKVKSPEFQQAIVIALQKITDSELCWTKQGESEAWKLIVVKEGSGKLWSDLKIGLKAFTRFNIHRYPGLDKAWAFPEGWRVIARDVYINENFSPLAPLEGGGFAQAPMAIVLWHELVGHAILRKGHPKVPWNTWSFHLSNPLPSGWGRIDPTIIIENEARRKMSLPMRRSQYWATKAAWNN